MPRYPTVEEFAVYSLYKHGRRMTVAEITTDIEYSHGYTRGALRDLRRRGEIEGAKINSVIACNVHGETIVLTSSFTGMLDTLRNVSASLASQARSTVTAGDVQGLHRFIKNHASATYQIGRRWKFWYPGTMASSSGGSPNPAASAD